MAWNYRLPQEGQIGLSKLTVKLGWGLEIGCRRQTRTLIMWGNSAVKVASELSVPTLACVVYNQAYVKIVGAGILRHQIFRNTR